MTLRVFHPLVGATLVDFDVLFADASPELRAVLERAQRLAHHRLATAQALDDAIAAHEAAPFFEHHVPRRLPTLEVITATDLCRALLGSHPQLWSPFWEMDEGVPEADVQALAQRWRDEAGREGPPLSLQPALARRLSWTRTLRPLAQPSDLFDALAIDVAAAVANLHVQYVDGLITLAEAATKLLDYPSNTSWCGPLPASYVDYGLLSPLYDAAVRSCAQAPLVIVRGPPGSGRRALARQAMRELSRAPEFERWGFNVDNYHGGFVDPEFSPAYVALSDRCIASYGTEELEFADSLVRSVLHRPEDARLILRLDADTLAGLIERHPQVADAPVIDMGPMSTLARTAVLLGFMLALDEWFRVDCGLPEAILLARQTAELEPLGLVLACAVHGLAREYSPQTYDLASVRSCGQIPDAWLFWTELAPPVHEQARALVASPDWRAIRPRRARRFARRHAKERPDEHATLVDLAARLHLRS